LMPTRGSSTFQVPLRRPIDHARHSHRELRWSTALSRIEAAAAAEGIARAQELQVHRKSSFDRVSPRL
jgi:hypothetical protein